MKWLALAVVVLVLIGLCVGPEEKSSPTADTTGAATVDTSRRAEVPEPQPEEQEGTPALSREEQRKLLKQIEVTVEPQDVYGDRQKYVFWVKNPTPYYFRGMLFVHAKDAQGITVDHEAFSIDRWVPPGGRTWGIAFFKEPWRITGVTYDLEGEFVREAPEEGTGE